MKKPLVYIAGAYSLPDPVTNTRRACLLGSQMIDEGQAWPIVPHTTMLFDLIAPKRYETWIAMDLAIVERCDAVIRLKGESEGADNETKHATSLGIPVFYSLKELYAWIDELIDNGAGGEA